MKMKLTKIGERFYVLNKNNQLKLMEEENETRRNRTTKRKIK